MRLALAIAAMIAVPITAAADEPAPAPAPAPAPSEPAPTRSTSQPTASGPTFAPGGVPIPPASTGVSTAPASTAPGGSAPGSSAPGTTPTVTTAPAGEAPEADPAYGERPDPDVRRYAAPRRKDVLIVSYPERSKSNIVMLASLGGSGVLLGAVGLYFHLDSRSAANEIGSHKFTGEVWSADRQDAYDRAHRSSVVAGVLYGLGGACLLATAIAYIVTEPEAEKMTIHPHGTPTARALVAPTRGGAIVGRIWSF